jgi:hypothetical protein
MPKIGPVKECTDYRPSCAPYECGSPIAGALKLFENFIDPAAFLTHSHDGAIARE